MELTKDTFQYFHKGKFDMFIIIMLLFCLYVKMANNIFR